jgi:hypothetical protein
VAVTAQNDRNTGFLSFWAVTLPPGTHREREREREREVEREAEREVEK